MRGSGNFRQCSTDGKKTLTTLLFACVFVPNFFLQFYKGVQWFILRKTLFLRFQRSPILSRSGPTFSGGVQMLISIKKTYRTCDFPGGGGGGVRMSYLHILDPSMAS